MIALFLIFLIFRLSNADCPPNENIRPCTCSTSLVDHLDYITCEGISSQATLLQAVKGMGRLRLSTFSLSKSNVGTLAADLFRDLQIESLSILFTNVTGLSESHSLPPFLGQEYSLEELEIRDAFQDAPLSRLSLSHLKHLRLLHLESLKAPTVGNDWFESGPYNLKELYLFQTETTVLGSHAFSSLLNLQQLAVTGSHLSSITREMFPKPALHLQSLDFSNNRLTTLPDSIFSKMPSLKEIFLENNDLTNLNEVIYSPVWHQLSHAYFYGNPLDCDSSMRWIFQYRLPDSLEGQCAEPERLRSKPLNTLTVKDFEE